MFLHWLELIYTDNISLFQDIVNQPLWFNSQIKYNKTLLCDPSLIQQGTMLIADILNADL